MTDAVWTALCEAIRVHVGIVLPPTMRGMAKRALVDLDLRNPEVDLVQLQMRDRFLDRLFIGTSWFHREHAGIDALVRALVPVAMERSNRSVNIWSVGCAAGQEPYGLAIALREAGCAPRIIATDFHRPSLAAAAEGRYPQAACAQLPGEWRARHFDTEPGGRVRVREHIRTSVRFVQHNFAIDRPIVSDMDAVVCRNVLIYFERATAVALVARLAAACRDGGHLLLGALEAPLLWMSASDPRFGGGPVPLVAISRGSPLRAPMSNAPAVLPRSSPKLFERPTTETTMTALVKARELDRAGKLEAALHALDATSVRSPLDASAHLARALLLKQLGRFTDAIRELRAARFLDPAAWLAPYQLAVCLERIGEVDEAYEAYQHAADAIAAGGPSGTRPADEAVEILAETTAAACRKKLASERALAVLGKS